MFAGAFMQDMTDYYERIHRQKLGARHQAMDFPAAAGCLSMQPYRGPRLLQLEQAVAKVGCPTWGIIAGCGVCSYHVQCFAFQSLLAFARAFPALGINMHHDDLFVGTTAPTRQQVEDQLAHGMDALTEVVEADLEANFAPHKATVVASDLTLQQQVAR